MVNEPLIRPAISGGVRCPGGPGWPAIIIHKAKPLLTGGRFRIIEGLDTSVKWTCLEPSDKQVSWTPFHLLYIFARPARWFIPKGGPKTSFVATSWFRIFIPSSSSFSSLLSSTSEKCHCHCHCRHSHRQPIMIHSHQRCPPLFAVHGWGGESKPRLRCENTLMLCWTRDGYGCWTKNRGILPVKIMENPIKMDDLGVYTPIFGNTHMIVEEAPCTHQCWRTGLSTQSRSDCCWIACAQIQHDLRAFASL